MVANELGVLVSLATPARPALHRGRGVSRLEGRIQLLGASQNAMGGIGLSRGTPGVLEEPGGED